MKFNLKNRPHIDQEEEGLIYISANYKKKLDAWFEGFEKELREKLESLEDKWYDEEGALSVDLIEEILGE